MAAIPGSLKVLILGSVPGPQRTAAALEAIDQGDWAGAARQMLDYYDRCYDHELGGLDAEQGAERLLARTAISAGAG
ncbi:MAG: hypothetical protein ACKOGI_00550 [Vulcanococcus sp.]